MLSPVEIFVVCLACGVASGVVYDLLYMLRRLVFLAAKPKRRCVFAVTAVCDIIYCAALSALFVACSVWLCFPDVRLYMIAAVLLGAGLYIKSLHVMVDFLLNKLYNRSTKRVKKGSKQ